MPGSAFPVRGSAPWDTVLQPYIDNTPWANIASGTFGPTGTADDTATFTAAIASGQKTLYVPDGTFIVSAILMNVANQTMLLSPNAILKSKVGGSQVVVEITGANAAIVGLGYGATIDNNSVGSSAGSCIYAHAGAGQIVQGLTLINCLGIGINAQSDQILIDNNTITNPGNAAIFLSNVASSNLVAPTVSGNRVTVASGSAYGIQSHAASGVIYRPRFYNNDITLPALVSSGLGIELFGGNSYGSVVGNTIEGSAIGISIDSGPSITVTGNSIHGAYNYGIEFASATFSTCTGNTIDGNSLTNTGVSISNTAGGHNTVSGNSISNLLTNAGTGVFPQNVAGTGTVIVGNNITCYHPVVLSGTSAHVVVGNNLTCVGTGTLNGVSLNTVTDTVVANNTISGATSGAVNVFTGTMNGIVIGPNILTGGTTPELLNGWTPGTSGTGSKLIRGNTTPASVTTPTVGASPYTYTNTSFFPQLAYVRGGTVSSITCRGTQVAGATEAAVYLNSGDAMVITYTAAPTVVVDTK